MSPPYSYITIIQKPLPQKPLPHKSLLKSPRSAIQNLVLLSPRRATRYFIPLLAIWALLNISQVLLPRPIVCFEYLHVLRPRARAPDEFMQWALADSTKLVPFMNFSQSYVHGLNVSDPSIRKYMMVVVSGGLNQQRNQIVDAVVIARILGAVLVVPVLQVNQIWGDESEFGDIFDVQHFKTTLKDDVKIVSSLPSTHVRAKKVRAPAMPFNANEQWVHEHYDDKLGKDTILLVRAFDSRLAKNLDSDLQKLRCKVAFEALKFQPMIQNIADVLVQRMADEGPYLALHLRLEKDVWVRTGCHSGLGTEADQTIENDRASNPKFLTSRNKLTAQERYLAGYCPLNAMEITRLLKGLGASKHTKIYYAGGEPFGGKKALEPLRKEFPNLYNKWSLARPGELDSAKNNPSILAALDYIVSLKSQVFLANHGGNMARALQGHRTFMGSGKFITPNKKLLVKLFSNSSISDQAIRNKIKRIHREAASLSSLVNSKEKTDVIAFPVPYCMCSKQSNNLTSSNR